jgi:hypothetical protein
MTIGDALINALPAYGTTWVLLFIGVSAIATSSIGIDAMDKNPDYKKDHGLSDGYLIINLILAILAVIIAALGMAHYFGWF